MVQIADFAGRFGLEKLINSATRVRNSDGSFTLSWSGEGLSVTLGLRIISSTQVQQAEAGAPRQGLRDTLPAQIAGTVTQDSEQPAADVSSATAQKVSE